MEDSKESEDDNENEDKNENPTRKFNFDFSSATTMQCDFPETTVIIGHLGSPTLIDLQENDDHNKYTLPICSKQFQKQDNQGFRA